MSHKRGFSVTVYPDSGMNLAARVARMIAEQRRIDPVNRDSGTVTMEFDELDGPPQPLPVSSGSAYLISHSCGDCAAKTLRFGNAGLIADVGLSADAAPGAAERMCEMSVVARSFAWRAP